MFKQFKIQKNLFLGILLFSPNPTTYAGILGPTWYSRANCFNNESITWNSKAKHWYYTRSMHYYRNDLKHFFNTGWELTWRSASVCWGESPLDSALDWRVVGYHWEITIPDYRVRYLGSTQATTCHLYDGWWEIIIP